jgi:hypothetical protein
MRRWTGRMNGERYLGNTSKTEVHDLDNEQTGANKCQIDEIHPGWPRQALRVA